MDPSDDTPMDSVSDSGMLNDAAINESETITDSLAIEAKAPLHEMMNAATSLVLESPDVNSLRQDRRDRTRAAMQVRN